MSDSSSESVAMDFKTLDKITTHNQEDSSHTVENQESEMNLEEEETSRLLGEESKEAQNGVGVARQEDNLVENILKDTGVIEQLEPNNETTKEVTTNSDNDIVKRILKDMECTPESKQEEVNQEAADTPSISDIQEDDNLSQEISENTDTDEIEEESDEEEVESVKKEYEIPFPITCTFTLFMLVYGVKAAVMFASLMSSICKSTCECSK